MDGYSLTLREDFSWVSEPYGNPITQSEMLAVLGSATALRIRATPTFAMPQVMVEKLSISIIFDWNLQRLKQFEPSAGIAAGNH